MVFVKLLHTTLSQESVIGSTDNVEPWLRTQVPLTPHPLYRVISSSYTLSLSPFSFLQSGAMRLASAEWLQETA